MNKTVEIDGVIYNVVSPYGKVNESELSLIDRLGLAYCRLNSYEWDEELLGDEPSSVSNSFYVRKMSAIEEIIGKANTSRCWWKFNLGRTEDEWRAWYYARHSSEPNRHEVERLLQSGDGKKRCGNKLKELPNFIRSLFFKE